ncbi:MAG TPA: hypothetical protein TECP_01160 [Hyphomicrobiaceae bacterium MAG_BT-2024]
MMKTKYISEELVRNHARKPRPSGVINAPAHKIQDSRQFGQTYGYRLALETSIAIGWQTKAQNTEQAANQLEI